MNTEKVLNNPSTPDDVFFSIKTEQVCSMLDTPIRIKGVLKSFLFLVGQCQYKLSKARVWEEAAPILKYGILQTAEILYNKIFIEEIEELEWYEVCYELFEETLISCLMKTKQMAQSNILQISSIFSGVYELSKSLKKLRIESEYTREIQIDEKSIIADIFNIYTNFITQREEPVFKESIGDLFFELKSLYIIDPEAQSLMKKYLSRKKEYLKVFKYLRKIGFQECLTNPTNKRHYMIPFKRLLETIDPNEIGSLVWGVKTLMMLFYEQLGTHKAFITFEGMVGIITNFTLFLQEVKSCGGSTAVLELGATPEFQIIKAFFVKTTYDETIGKSYKTSQIISESVITSEDIAILNSPESKMHVNIFERARTKHWSIQEDFNLHEFINNISFFMRVK